MAINKNLYNKQFQEIDTETRLIIAESIKNDSYTIYDLDLLLNEYLRCIIGDLSDGDKLDIKNLRQTIKGIY